MNTPTTSSGESSAPRSAVVLVCDRLNPAFLGPYGNTWIETAAMNQLAAQSMLVEHCLTNSLDLNTVYESFWMRDGQSLIARLVQRAIPTVLLTDDHSLIAHPLAGDFDRHVCLPESEDNESESPAASIAETAWATIMSSALDEMHAGSDAAGQEAERLLWIHARGCDGKWDAPYGLREPFAGEGDPPPPAFVANPSQRLAKEVDPDELLGWQQAYAGEISAFDECLGPIVDCLSTKAMANTLFVLTSSRGFPLGEHGVVGDAEEILHGESLHVPLVIRFPDGRYPSERTQSIWQPRDVCELVGRWLNGGSISEEQLGGERAIAAACDSWAMRTPSWFATGKLNDETESRLYTKPDDRFECNDVAGICENIVDGMRAEFTRTNEAAQSGKIGELPKLSDELRDR